MRSTLLAFTLAITALASPELQAQQFCDPKLKPAAGEVYPYGPRGDRCEGLYEVELSGNDELPVAGLMAPGPNLDFRGSQRVHLRWRGQLGRVRLQAGSVRWRTYYRMDTTQPAAAGVFSWPTLILGAENLFRSEIAVLAWLEEGLPPARRMHLPVAVDTAARRQPPRAYELVVVPTTDFAQVNVTLRRVLPGGGLEVVGAPNVDVGEPAYEREQEFRVPVPLTGTLIPGDYEITLSGRRDTGGWVHTVFRFRHAAAPL